MNLLTLSPEATRLRRIARACCAGEVSRLEYREARRRVINKSVSAANAAAEDTVSRLDLDITQRRSAATSDTDEEVRRQNWLVWMLLFAVLLAALTLPVWTYANTVIPPLAERDPNPASAPHFPVERVRWARPDELSSEFVAAADAFIAEGLQALKTQNAPLQHGFSDAELQQVGRFLNAIGVHDEDSDLSPRDLEDLHALIAAQKDKRGVSLIQLQQLAQTLQDWVRKQGYPIARAYVPAQTVAAGEVEFGVQLGLLSAITVAGAGGNELPVQRRLAGLVGQHVRRDAVETRLNTLNRSAGIRADVSFIPGNQVGETEMILHVKKQRRFEGSVGLDNYGVKELGEERVLFAGQWNNALGVGDVLSAQAYTTLNPADNQYGQAAYRMPVLGGRFDAAAQLGLADIALGGSDPLDGDGTLFDAQLSSTQVFTRTRRREVIFAVGTHSFDWDIVPDQRTWFASAGVDGHRLWDSAQVALSGSVQALAGGVDDARPGQDSNFWRLRADLSGWTPVPLPWSDVRGRFVLGLQLQASTDVLPPTLRLDATGPYANKGFSQAQVLFDQGVGINSALRFDAPAGQWWMFMDSSYGETAGLADAWTHLTSLGVGWEASLMRQTLSSRVTLGYPITHKGTSGLNHDGMQFYWSLRYAL